MQIPEDGLQSKALSYKCVDLSLHNHKPHIPTHVYNSSLLRQERKEKQTSLWKSTDQQAINTYQQARYPISNNIEGKMNTQGNSLAYPCSPCHSMYLHSQVHAWARIHTHTLNIQQVQVHRLKKIRILANTGDS